MIERVILVDRSDREIGTAEKMDAHVRPRLHRAFSVFVFDQRGHLLLQRRAADKYHSANLWTNTACGHPRPGEDVAAAARRRLKEEMGIDVVVADCTSFIYRAQIDARLTEHELDHVLVGFSDDVPLPDASEVGEWRWCELNALEREIVIGPHKFTAWFPQAFRLAKPFAARRARCETREASRTPSLR